MADRAQLFIGRLAKDVRTRELEDIFSRYGRLLRCEIKYGPAMNYAFVDYDDKRDAEDAIRYEDGRDIRGSAIVVEWSKGPNYRFRPGSGRHGYGGGGGYRGSGNGRYHDDYDRGGGGGGGGRRRRSSSRDRRRSRSRSRGRRSRTRSRTRSRSRDRSYSRSKSRSVTRSRSRSGGKGGRENGDKSP